MPIKFDDHEPKTLEEAIDILDQCLDDAERAYVLKTGAVGLHFGFGMSMRNGWNLWRSIPDKSTALAQNIIERFGVSHGDDLSGLILDGLVARLKGEEFRPKEKAAGFKEHWEGIGIDPLKAGGDPAPKSNLLTDGILKTAEIIKFPVRKH
jgi:hypothetical protein